QGRGPPHGRHDAGAEGDVGHEVPVHDVQVQPLHAGVLGLLHALPEPREVGRPDRCRELEVAHRAEYSPGLGARPPGSGLAGVGDGTRGARLPSAPTRCRPFRPRPCACPPCLEIQSEPPGGGVTWLTLAPPANMPIPACWSAPNGWRRTSAGPT